VGLEPAQRFEIVGVVAAGGKQAGGGAVVELFPPQVEEEDSVLEVGEQFVNVTLEGQGVLVLGVLGEPQATVVP
jgi:hypothetical protein